MPRKTVGLIIFIIIIALVSFGIFVFKTLRAPGVSGDREPISIKELFPFGPGSSSNIDEGSQNLGDGGENIGDLENSDNNLELRQLTTAPVAGIYPISVKKIITVGPSNPEPVENGNNPDPFLSPESSESASLAPVQQTTTKEVDISGIRYVDRGTGNVYDIYTDDFIAERITNTTIPRVYEAFFGNSGKNVVIRYQDLDSGIIETFSAKVPAISAAEPSPQENPYTTSPTYPEALPPGPQALSGIFFPENILDLSISPKGDRVFYLESVPGGSSGTTANFENGTKSAVFSSPLSEWKSSWLSDKNILMTTKPSGLFPGYAYILDTSAKTFIKTLGNIPGLTTLPSSSGKRILYGESESQSSMLNIFDFSTRTVAEIGIRSVPEKCVWKNDDIAYCAAPNTLAPAVYPDFWYQGRIAFSDSIWKLDFSTNRYDIVKNLNDSGSGIDAIKIAISNDGNYLFFINKKDSTLWMLKLES